MLALRASVTGAAAARGPAVAPPAASRAVAAVRCSRPSPLRLGEPKQQSHICRAIAEPTGNGASPATAKEVAKPVVQIDNTSDSFATIIHIQFGDELGDLLDTMAALKNLGLNIRRAKLRNKEDTVNKNKFYVTEAKTSEKIMTSERLEEIRLTILNTMVAYHPEAGDNLALGIGRKYVPKTRDPTHPLGTGEYNGIETEIDITEDETGTHSELRIRTADRPGLLVDVVHILKDVSVNVVSAEVDTVGTEADDILFVTYHGEPLNASMCELVKNALQYYLSLSEIARDESY